MFLCKKKINGRELKGSYYYVHRNSDKKEERLRRRK